MIKVENEVQPISSMHHATRLNETETNSARFKKMVFEGKPANNQYTNAT